MKAERSSRSVEALPGQTKYFVDLLEHCCCHNVIPVKFLLTLSIIDIE